MQKKYKMKVLSLGTWPTEGPGFQLAVDAWRAFTAGLERLAQEDVPANDDRVTQLVAAAQQAARQVRVDPHPHPTPQPPSETIQPTASPPQAYPQPTLSLPYPQPQPLTQLSFPHMQAAAAAASTGSAAQRTAGPHQVVEQTVDHLPTHGPLPALPRPTLSLPSAYPQPTYSRPTASPPQAYSQPTLSLPSPYPTLSLSPIRSHPIPPDPTRSNPGLSDPM